MNSHSIAVQADAQTMAPEPKSRGRTVLAVIFGPVLGGAVGMFALGIVTVAIWFVVYRELFPAISGFWAMPFLGAFVGGTVGIPAMLVAGLPAHALLYHRGLRSPVIYALAGALAGLAAALVAGQLGVLDIFNSDLPAEEEPPNGLMSAVWMFPQAAVFGACSALGFWLIRRPDRDAPNPPTPMP